MFTNTEPSRDRATGSGSLFLIIGYFFKEEFVLSTK